MCQFKSAIVLREPRNKGGFALIHSFATDSHSELILEHKLKDDGRLRFARVEFIPAGDDWIDLKNYKLKIDEERTPEWFDDEMKSAVAEKLREIIKRMIVPAGREYLLGGAWIVPKNRTVSVSKNTLVVRNYGTVSDNYGTVTANYGTVSANYGTVSANSGTGRIERNYGTGRIERNSGTGRIERNYGTVSDNYGTVSDNYGTVTDNYGTVSDNYGTVRANYGTGRIERNYSTVSAKKGK